VSHSTEYVDQIVEDYQEEIATMTIDDVPTFVQFMENIDAIKLHPHHFLLDELRNRFQKPLYFATIQTANEKKAVDEAFKLAQLLHQISQDALDVADKLVPGLSIDRGTDGDAVILIESVIN